MWCCAGAQTALPPAGQAPARLISAAPPDSCAACPPPQEAHLAKACQSSRTHIAAPAPAPQPAPLPGLAEVCLHMEATSNACMIWTQARCFRHRWADCHGAGTREWASEARSQAQHSDSTRKALLTQGLERPEALQEWKHNEQHNNEADNIKTPIDEARPAGRQPESAPSAWHCQGNQQDQMLLTPCSRRLESQRGPAAQGSKTRQILPRTGPASRAMGNISVVPNAMLDVTAAFTDLHSKIFVFEVLVQAIVQEDVACSEKNRQAARNN